MKSLSGWTLRPTANNNLSLWLAGGNKSPSTRLQLRSQVKGARWEEGKTLWLVHTTEPKASPPGREGSTCLQWICSMGVKTRVVPSSQIAHLYLHLLFWSAWGVHTDVWHKYKHISMEKCSALWVPDCCTQNVECGTLGTTRHLMEPKLRDRQHHFKLVKMAGKKVALVAIEMSKNWTMQIIICF